MIEGYKRKEEDQEKIQANEDKFIEKVLKDRTKTRLLEVIKPKSKDDMARCIQRLWRGHYERKFQSIGRRNKFDSGKGITLWRTFRFISIHKYDKVLG